MPRRASGVAMKPCPSPFAPSQTSSFSFSRPIPAIRRFISNVLVDFIPRASGHTTGRSPSTYRMACSGSGSGRVRITIASSPNKRLKLPGGDRSEGSGVLSAGAHELSFNGRWAGERVARSLSAIR